MFVIQMHRFGYFKDSSLCYGSKKEARKFTTYKEADKIVEYWKKYNMVLGESCANARVVKLIPF